MVQAGAHTLVDETPVQIGVLVRKASEKSGAFLMYKKGLGVWVFPAHAGVILDRYEVSWHAGARPDHAAWQGKVYTMEQLKRICGLGTGLGLLGWNCRHEYYLFFLGSERRYTDKWLAEQNAKEARTQPFRGREYNLY